MDRIVGADSLPPGAEKMRRLMHYGQIMQSHALHFFHLSSPDLLLGFDAPPAARNIVGVARAYPEIARKGVMLRKFGQELIRVTAGKRVHGTGSVPGGMNRHLSRGDRDALLGQWPQMLQWAQEAVDIIERLYEENRAAFDEFGSYEAAMLSLVRADGALDLYDGRLRARDARGRVLVDQADAQDYLAILEEEVRSWSYMKFPYLRALGREQGWYRVGPLARIQNCDFIPTALAEERRQAFLASAGPGPVHATLAFHRARMIEMLHSVEVIGGLLRDDDLLQGELSVRGERRKEGVGILEAPRGTLIHHYRVGDDDLVTMCNLIVSTTHNNQAMNETIGSVARQVFDGREITEGMLNRIEVAIRAYDPCLSCATHALGRMPLLVTALDPAGEVVDAVLRTDAGALERLPAAPRTDAGAAERREP